MHWYCFCFLFFFVFRDTAGQERFHALGPICYRDNSRPTCMMYNFWGVWFCFSGHSGTRKIPFIKTHRPTCMHMYDLSLEVCVFVFQDSAGQERFHSLRPMYYRDSIVVGLHVCTCMMYNSWGVCFCFSGHSGTRKIPFIKTHRPTCMHMYDLSLEVCVFVFQDSAGQERFHSLRPMYYRDSIVVGLHVCTCMMYNSWGVCFCFSGHSGTRKIPRIRTHILQR